MSWEKLRGDIDFLMCVCVCEGCTGILLMCMCTCMCVCEGCVLLLLISMCVCVCVCVCTCLLYPHRAVPPVSVFSWEAACLVLHHDMVCGFCCVRWALA